MNVPVFEDALRVHQVLVVLRIVLVDGDLVGAFVIAPYRCPVAKILDSRNSGFVLVALEVEVALADTECLLILGCFQRVVELHRVVLLVLQGDLLEEVGRTAIDVLGGEGTDGHQRDDYGG